MPPGQNRRHRAQQTVRNKTLKDQETNQRTNCRNWLPACARLQLGRFAPHKAVTMVALQLRPVNFGVTKQFIQQPPGVPKVIAATPVLAARDAIKVTVKSFRAIRRRRLQPPLAQRSFRRSAVPAGFQVDVAGPRAVCGSLPSGEQLNAIGPSFARSDSTTESLTSGISIFCCRSQVPKWSAARRCRRMRPG